MIKEYGRAMTKQIILEEIANLQQKITKAPTIYSAIDIEHDILDRKSMLKWLSAKDV